MSPSTIIMPSKAADEEEDLPPPIGRDCTTCDFWVKFPQAGAKGGACHGNPPIPIVVGVQQGPLGQQPVSMSFYPQTGRGDWCRLWELVKQKETVQ